MNPAEPQYLVAAPEAPDAPTATRALQRYHAQVEYLFGVLSRVDLLANLDAVLEMSLLADEAFNAGLMALNEDPDEETRALLTQGLLQLQRSVVVRRDAAHALRGQLVGAAQALKLMVNAIANTEEIWHPPFG
jgi:hypothetical protein